MGPTPTPTRTFSPTSSSRGSRPAAARAEVGVSGDFPVQLATIRTRTTILADLSADLSDTRGCPLRIRACTRLQNYTIGASLKSVSVSVPWNSSYTDHLAIFAVFVFRNIIRIEVIWTAVDWETWVTTIARYRLTASYIIDQAHTLFIQ